MRLTDGSSVEEDACVTEPDLAHLLLEASRVLGAEVVAALQERGFPDARPGHSVIFMHIDRRSGTRLTELARRARVSKQGMMLVVAEARRTVAAVEARARRDLGERRYEAFRSALEDVVGISEPSGA
jgi:hypothetical protein